jgi:SAM-dependent methyltransferase
MVVNDPADQPGAAADARRGSVAESHKRDFWIKENLKHAVPHYRLQKTARLITRLAGGRQCDLLDLGCGPATLMHLLPGSIRYFGIDIAIHAPAPNLLEADILQGPIRFGDRRFDLVVAQGLFEYVGDHQAAKLAEIAALLNEGGTFVVTYTNFGHRDRHVFEAFSNVQSLARFRDALSRNFTVRKTFPTAYNWHGGQPRRGLVKAVNMHLNANIPGVAPRLAVEYFFVCAPRGGRD